MLPLRKKIAENKGDVSGLFRAWSCNNSHSNLSCSLWKCSLSQTELINSCTCSCSTVTFFLFNTAQKRPLMFILLVYVHQDMHQTTTTPLLLSNWFWVIKKKSLLEIPKKPLCWRGPAASGAKCHPAGWPATEATKQAVQNQSEL